MTNAANHRASLDAGEAFCYISSAIGPARVSEGPSAVKIAKLTILENGNTQSL
jgi:hypothetical protein